MADFCKACSIDLFGEDLEDLADITKEEDFKKGLAYIVTCEGCGFIQVDPEGNCLSKDCLSKELPGHGIDWKGRR